jgi:WhiB family redox-sensing transcriptional regulator
VQELMAVSDIVINQRVENGDRTESTVDLTRLEKHLPELDLVDGVTPVEVADNASAVNHVENADHVENANHVADVEDVEDQDDELDDDADGADDDLVMPTTTPPSNLIQIGTLAQAGSDVLPPELAWQERALCAQTDPEAFFPEKGGSTREAKRVCMSCEVRAECLDYALAKDERFGIWGGLSERERRRVKKQAV